MIVKNMASGINIFKCITKKKNDISSFYQETTRGVLRLSISFVHYLLYYLIKEGDKQNIYADLEVTIIGVITSSLCSPQIKSDEYCKVSNIIFIISFLLVPILHTLTKEICTDTIFFWHSICQVFYIANSVVFSIYSKTPVRRIYNEEEVLPLEESINIPNPYRPSMVCGYVSATIGMILLSSRFTNVSSVFCFLTISIIYFIGLPRYQEKLKMHKSFLRTFIWLAFVSRLLFMIHKPLFLILLGLVTYMYGMTFLVGMALIK